MSRNRLKKKSESRPYMLVKAEPNIPLLGDTEFVSPTTREAGDVNCRKQKYICKLNFSNAIKYNLIG